MGSLISKPSLFRSRDGESNAVVEYATWKARKHGPKIKKAVKKLRKQIRKINSQEVSSSTTNSWSTGQHRINKLQENNIYDKSTYDECDLHSIDRIMGVPLFGDADDPENYSIMSTSSDNSIRLNNNDDGKIGIENRSDNASPLQYKRKAPPAIITNKGVLGYDEASIIEGSTSKGLTFTKIIASIDLFDATASPNSQQVFTPDTSMDTKNQFNDGTPTTAAAADTNDNNGNTNNPSVVDDEMSNGDDKNEIISRVVPRARIPNDSKDIVNHHEKNLLSVPSQIIIPNPNSVSRVDRDMEEERERILEEAAELKKIAEWYHMPNKPIATTDALAGASNYFS